MKRENSETGTDIELFVKITGKKANVSVIVIILHDMKTCGGSEV
jgi:hypothetical protein